MIRPRCVRCRSRSFMSLRDTLHSSTDFSASQWPLYSVLYSTAHAFSVAVT
jgi:hypothetical protein